MDLEATFKSSEDIMKDALFSEIITFAQNEGVVITFLEGSKKIEILQEVVLLLQEVKVLSLTQDVCRVLISHQTGQNKGSFGLQTSNKETTTSVESRAACQGKERPNLLSKENVKNALFDEVVQAIIQDECCLIMTTNLRSSETLERAIEVLNGARIIYLATYSCEEFLSNDLEKQEMGSPTKNEKNSKRPLSKVRTCDLCNKKFSRRSGLLTHKKAIHERSLPHKCDLCDKAFVYPKELRVHKMSHTGIHPHCCKVCGKGFVALKHLERHQPVHTGVRAFVCTICSASFAHKANLDRHVKSKHEGQRPYVCSLCVDKKYCDRGGLRKHLASVHRILDLPKKRAKWRVAMAETGAHTLDVENSVTNKNNSSAENDQDAQDDSVGQILSQTDVIVDITDQPPLISSHHGLSAAVSATQTDVSASKILQQLSQSMAAEVRAVSSSSIALGDETDLQGNDDTRVFSTKSISLLEQTMSSGVGPSREGDITTGAIMNVAFSDA